MRLQEHRIIEPKKASSWYEMNAHEPLSELVAMREAIEVVNESEVYVSQTHANMASVRYSVQSRMLPKSRKIHDP
jgi:hypothetical protein